MRYVLRTCPGSAHAARTGSASREGAGSKMEGRDGFTVCVNWKLISNTDDTDQTDFHGYQI
ncbi:MAG: hypothetical protein KJ729_01515, partial [Euryarchaeota archaeon]|nr:hypothetical protein [Euryarchaeota archaeon]